MKKKLLAIALSASMMLGLAACGGNADTNTTNSGADSSTTEATTDASEESTGTKTMIIGDTTFNSENSEETVNPHNTYNGWACIRYGIGETLVRYSDSMEIEPWLAKEWENVDDTTWKITLQDGVKFHSGRDMDAEAVKQCLEHLIEVHDRAPGDLMIDSIEADGQVLTIKTSEPRPALLNYLGDPYGCIIDVDASDFDNGVVSGTGPYVVKEMVTDDHLTLTKNDDYWNGTPKIDELTIRTITDGDTLAMALQSGEIDAAYGMAYANYPLFENDNYKFSSIATSRAFFAWMNYKSDIIQDEAVRKAIAMGINKQGFVDTLLEGHGYTGNGAFPEGLGGFGGEKVKTESYDAEGAKKVLEDAGWKDTDGDGIREKNGKKLTIRWLTYPSRQELPLLAESVQASLKEIGIEVDINCTSSHKDFRKDPTTWDVYASAQVNAPTGDPEYFFTVGCLDESASNFGSYHSDKLEELEKQMKGEFDSKKRAELAVQMQQTILDDNAYVFCSFLEMNLIKKSTVTGYDAHPCDYYQVTADLDIE